MANQAEDRYPPRKTDSGDSSYPIANAITVYNDMLCQLLGGFLNHWDETGTFLGVVAYGKQPGPKTGDTSADIPPEVGVEEGYILERRTIQGTPTAADRGSPVWCPDSDPLNITLVDTTGPSIGWLKRVHNDGSVDIRLYSPTEFQAANES